MKAIPSSRREEASSTHTYLLSIVIPTFQSGKTLSFCLDSIIKQRFSDWEVVIIDGASTDETVAIARKYASQSNSIKFFSEPDEGIYDAMNKALTIASGEWIYFLGSDDYFVDDNVLWEIFGDRDYLNYQVIYGNVFFRKQGEKYDGPFDPGKLKRKNICHQAIFYHKSIFRKFGNFNCKYKICADWEFNLRWFNKKRVKKKYVDVVIAFFSAGGSSTGADKVLQKEKKQLFIKYGYTKLGIRERVFSFFGKPKNFTPTQIS